MRVSLAAHLLAACVQAYLYVDDYEDVLLRETCLVQTKGIRSKKYTFPSPLHQATPKQASGNGNAMLWNLAGAVQSSNHSKHNLPESIHQTSLKQATGNSTSLSLIQGKGTNHSTTSTASHNQKLYHEKKDFHSVSTIDRGTHPMASNAAQVGERADAHQAPLRSSFNTNAQSGSPKLVDNIMHKTLGAFVALRNLGRGMQSVPEGALVFGVFVAFALFVATMVVCTFGNSTKEHRQHEYHPMAVNRAVIQVPAANVAEPAPPPGRVPFLGARPNAPARRSDASSAGSPDSSLNLSRASITSSTDSKNKDKQQQPVLLCPSLVVPQGMDLVFAIRSALSQQRQELDFNILDLQGAPLCRVVVAERGERKAPCCGIFLQTLTRMPLAVVNTEQLYAGSGPPSICRPNGSLFGVLKHNGSAGYSLKHTSGRRLLEFTGDFRRKSATAVDSSGLRVCVTEPNDQGYQIRIGPRVDAGMVISCLLAIDKLEGFALNESST